MLGLKLNNVSKRGHLKLGDLDLSLALADHTDVE